MDFLDIMLLAEGLVAGGVFVFAAAKELTKRAPVPEKPAGPTAAQRLALPVLMGAWKKIRSSGYHARGLELLQLSELIQKTRSGDHRATVAVAMDLLRLFPENIVREALDSLYIIYRQDI